MVGSIAECRIVKALVGAAIAFGEAQGDGRLMTATRHIQAQRHLPIKQTIPLPLPLMALLPARLHPETILPFGDQAIPGQLRVARAMRTA